MTTPGRLLESEADLERVVRDMHTVAVVGAKDGRRPEEPAYSIPRMLQRRGCTVTPINPTIPEAFGTKTLASVAELPSAVDVLDVFRRIDALPALADELLALPEARRPRLVWLQSGIQHDEVAARLVAGGMDVVQDSCLGVYVQRYR